MEKSLNELKKYIREISANPNFIHHNWFVKWHLEIAEKISLELLDIYKEADRDIVIGLVWMHDYGKIIDFKNEHQATLDKGKEVLLKFDFPEDYIDKLIKYIEMFDNHAKMDLNNAPIEIKIVSSADAASHMVGPFAKVYWKEFSHKSFEELLADGVKKFTSEWNEKILLPEIKKAFADRHKFMMELSGELPDKFI